MSEKLYKVLGNGHSAYYGGNGVWTPLKWMPPIEGDLVECENGYHLCRRGDLLKWLGPEIHEVTYRDERIDGRDKVVVREARTVRCLKAWNGQSARMFAVDCAERVMRLGDETVLSAVLAVAWLYAIGERSEDELHAARDAARAAAGAAARDAARAAAGAAAWAAARAAAGAAEREWQTERLFSYLYPEEDQPDE